MHSIHLHEVQLKQETLEFPSKKDEDEYIAWLKAVQQKMRQPMPHHNSVEEVCEDI